MVTSDTGIPAYEFVGLLINWRFFPGHLKDGEWNPLLEGYDYLAMMDHEEEEKKRKEKPNESDGEAASEDAMTGQPKQRMERLRQRKPEDFRDEDERVKHDEL